MYRVCCVLYDGWCLMSDTWCLVCGVCCLMSDICCLFQTSDISWLMSDVWCAILLSDVRRQIIIIKIIIFITWYCANEHILKDQKANPKTWKANLFKYFYTAVSRLAALIVSGFKYYTISIKVASEKNDAWSVFHSPRCIIVTSLVYFVPATSLET